MQKMTFKVEGRLVASRPDLLTESLFLDLRKSFQDEATSRSIKVPNVFLNEIEGAIDFTLFVDASSWSECSEQVDSLLEDVFEAKPLEGTEDSLRNIGSFEEDGIAYSYA